MLLTRPSQGTPHDGVAHRPPEGSMPTPLPTRFFQRHTVDVARDLLGCEVWRRDTRSIVRRGRIVETEAYRGFDDRACHGWRGETPRLRSMFGPGGRAFVYLTYGIHHMFNVVTESAGYPSGVLIRAVEPLANVEGNTRGPGLLTRALNIDRRHDGSHLRDGPLRVLAGTPRPEERIEQSSRVGIAGAGPEAAAREWRFYLAGNAYLSHGRPTSPIQARAVVAARAARRTKLRRT